MKIYANVIYRNLQLIDAFVNIKQVVKNGDSVIGVIGVSQTESHANNGKYLFDFKVVANSEAELIPELFKKFDADGTKYTYLEAILKEPEVVPAVEEVKQVIEPVVEEVKQKPKRGRKKKVN